jgi:hypothetical protein
VAIGRHQHAGQQAEPTQGRSDTKPETARCADPPGVGSEKSRCGRIEEQAALEAEPEDRGEGCEAAGAQQYATNVLGAARGDADDQREEDRAPGRAHQADMEDDSVDRPGDRPADAGAG